MAISPELRKAMETKTPRRPRKEVNEEVKTNLVEVQNTPEVNGYANGIPFRFLIDGGTQINVMTKEAAELLGLAIQSYKGNMLVANGSKFRF